MPLSKEPKQGKQKSRMVFAEALADFTQIGITMAASVLIGVLIGSFLDRRLNTSPWLLLVFAFIGVGAAFRSLLALAERRSHGGMDDEKNDNEENDK